MSQVRENLVPRRVWLATGVLVAVLAAGLVLFFLLDADVRPLLPSATRVPVLTA